jgi:CMP-N,N'-diacetyllegionaminic acid synthase
LLVYSLIPARKGSKGIPNKNILPFRGKPLIAHSVEQSLQTPEISRTFVSTDSEAYREVSIVFGAEAPFLRPDRISQDTSTDYEVFEHFFHELSRLDIAIPDAVVHLRPTSPIRPIDGISEAIALLEANPGATSVRSVEPAPKTPLKVWKPLESGFIEPALKCSIEEAHSMPRQMLPEYFQQNACIDVIRTDTLLKSKSMTGDRVLPFFMESTVDIDLSQDLIESEKNSLLQLVFEPKLEPKRICFDIDGVVASKTPGNDYSLAEPRPVVIELINALHSNGHEIVLFTARGNKTGLDHRPLTAEQMRSWGVSYTHLMFDKPWADLYIDDKALNIADVEAVLSRKNSN